MEQIQLPQVVNYQQQQQQQLQKQENQIKISNIDLSIPFKLNIQTSFKDQKVVEQLNQLLIIDQKYYYVRQYGKMSQQEYAHYQTKNHIISSRMTYNEFIDKVRDGEGSKKGLYLAMYSGGDEVQKNLKENTNIKNILNTISVDWMNHIDKLNLNLWIAPPNHTEQLHYDLFDNVTFQISGVKKWRLFSPKYDMKPLSIMTNSHGAGSNFSTLNIDPDHLQKQKAEGQLSKSLKEALENEITIYLYPGDCLFVPAGWWHCVQGIQGNENNLIMSCNLFQPSFSVLFFQKCNWKYLRLRIEDLILNIKESWNIITKRPIPTIEEIQIQN